VRSRTPPAGSVTLNRDVLDIPDRGQKVVIRTEDVTHTETVWNVDIERG
jgi:hypothetical protein